ncbi:putative disease resistance RPP13-like protein 1 [Arachis hypogaea]|uniref:putative disease resistance RPP13-like protein 1 n=1 Tax=Arachis hypogaea TaxID=3818 RepID=UPI000DED221C|nr:putative disease resistance RPP13-like protein 1 [Arachis hypogaea]XP_029149458.1 putative disease resistance RPP13-like protein 1 [Arachis hypogaea]XP_029149459.1 putative disease resistance RPP13-like protein 1 [Arachis hypogaea]XP_029149460.1 putative disease resistance RPP13-like protein 1 [Arachis hypogaea]XP_029149461.1 putative disease resistance RPP13-like protein 1 [Arachis hypogaea]
MAEKLYGGAYLSPFVDAVLDNLTSILEEDDSFLERNNLLVTLQNCLYDVGPVLDDAELKQFSDKKVKKWLVDLQDALYMADDLLDKLSTKAAIAATQRDPGNSSSWSRLVDSYIEDTGDMEKIVGTLESVVRRKNYLLKESAKVDMTWRIPSTCLVEPSGICGRKEDKEAILKLLLDDDDAADGDLSVIPIVGMGGIGKTTLAQLLYHDDQVKENFDFRGWVCVSEEFDVVKVTKTVIEAITSSSCNLTDLNLLQLDLKEKLSRQKFFIVLDDVWNENYDDWNTLLKPFQKGVKGSKILITTRNKNVAFVVQTVSPYELSLLSDEDCCSVFSKHARLSTVSVENLALEKIGRDIVKKCDGLPLAAQALGSILRGNSDIRYWNHLLKSEIWELSNDKINAVPALRISYYFLPSYLKQCFIYCSLYPKDYEFSKDELMLLWMAENFLQTVEKKTIEEVGGEYFDELIARSFLQPHSTKENKFVMHDLVHDLAMTCGGEFYFRAEELRNAVEVDIKARHLSHNAKGNYPMSNLLGVCDRLKHTRTFLEINLNKRIPFNMENVPCIMLSQLKYLRTLSFKSFPVESMPDSMGELIHLRYLDLSWTDIVALPESLGNLYNLQTLKLYSCSNLKMLPVGMKDLVNLRHLDIRVTQLREMPKGMSNLKSLQFLSDYIVGKHEENKIKELGALADLHESISIGKLENVVNSSEALEARMSNKDGIDSITLTWSSNEEENTVDSEMERDILDKLQPHINLKELQIKGYRGTRFPDWVGHSSYHNITKITLVGCRSCCMLPSLGQLPSLKHLEILYFESVGIVGAEFYFYLNGESCLKTPPFPLLESLSFYSMRCWKEWHSLEFNAFPRLKHLSISECPMLRGDLPNHLPSLQSLEISQCKQLSWCVPRSPGMTSLRIKGPNEVRIGELPPLLRELSVAGNHHVESVVEAIMHMQLICLTSLSILGCSSHIWFPVGSIPASLQKLTIQNCRKLEFQMNGQHHSLQELFIENSCDSVTSFSLLDSFPNLVRVNINFCDYMECIVVSRSLPCLRSLCIFGCGRLKYVSTLWMAAPQLEHLTLLGCPEVDLSPTGDGVPHCSLRSLEISYSKKLVSSAAFKNSQFHGLTYLSIHGEYCESVKSLPKEGWLPASLEFLTLFHMKSVETLECKGLAHLTSLQKLRIEHCSKLKNMEGEKLPASLIQLIILGSPLLAKRCEKKDPQLWPKISHIPAIQVDDTWIW